MTLEDDIASRIVDRFFEPSWVMTSIMDYNNGVPTGTYTMQPQQTEAPMLRVARGIWDAKKDEILAAVLERVDVDAIVEQCSDVITKAVVAKLTAEPDNRWNRTPDKSARERMLEKVYADIAEEFGRQAVEHLRRTGGLTNILEAAAPEPIVSDMAPGASRD